MFAPRLNLNFFCTYKIREYDTSDWQKWLASQEQIVVRCFERLFHGCTLGTLALKCYVFRVLHEFLPGLHIWQSAALGQGLLSCVPVA